MGIGSSVAIAGALRHWFVSPSLEERVGRGDAWIPVSGEVLGAVIVAHSATIRGPAVVFGLVETRATVRLEELSLRGGAKASTGALTLARCRLEGLGVVVSSARLEVLGCAFRETSVAVSAENANVTLEDSVFEKSEGLVSTDSTWTALNCSFVGNAGVRGGALSLRGSDFAGARLEFRGNRAKDEGGALFASESTLVLEDSTVVHNVAQSTGGGAAIDASDLETRNVTFAENVAPIGAGLALTETSSWTDAGSVVQDVRRLLATTTRAPTYATPAPTYATPAPSISEDVGCVRSFDALRLALRKEAEILVCADVEVRETLEISKPTSMRGVGGRRALGGKRLILVVRGSRLALRHLELRDSEQGVMITEGGLLELWQCAVRGCGLVLEAATLFASETTISNTTDAIVAVDSIVTLLRSELRSNSAAVQLARGSRLAAEASLFADNHGDSGGAISAAQGVHVFANDCTFRANSARSRGGAIFAADVLSLVDCRFETNEAENGGAVASRGLLVTVRAVFDGNIAVDRGAAVYFDDGGGGGGAWTDSGGSILRRNVAGNPGDVVFLGDGANFYGGGGGGGVMKDNTEDDHASRLAAAFDNDESYFELRRDVEVAETLSLHDRDLLCVVGRHALDGKGRARLIAVSAATLELRGLTLRGGKAESGGALALASGASARLFDCTVVANAALDQGGAVSVEENARLVAAHSRFFQNRAQRGGAVAATAADVSIAACDLTNNTAETGGGLFVEEDTELKVVEGRVSRNSALDGAGLFATRARVSCSDATFAQNEAREADWRQVAGASRGGAATLHDASSFQASRCRFEGNFAHDAGGALFVAGTLVTVDSLFAQNSAELGAAVHLDNRAVWADVRSTVSRNAGGPAVALSHAASYAATTTFHENQGGPDVWAKDASVNATIQIEPLSSFAAAGAAAAPPPPKPKLHHQTKDHAGPLAWRAVDPVWRYPDA